MSGPSGEFYWPAEHYSVPADSLCWHIAPSPNADHRCIRPDGHRGAHLYEYSPKVKAHPHKAPSP
jgi:hypothetical protein